MTCRFSGPPIKSPAPAPDPPKIKGMRCEYIGKKLNPMGMKGCKYFAFYCDDGEGWVVEEFKPGLVYPASCPGLVYARYRKDKPRIYKDRRKFS